jgi:solute carrier family 66, member 2
VLAPFPGLYSIYSNIVGYTGLGVEATLPLPQIFANARMRTCKGFRLSVLVSWLAGDFMKMFWFFNATTEISLPFKLCGIFQACCDAFLGAQFFIYGTGDNAATGQFIRPNGVISRPPSTVSIPMLEKDSRLE